MVKNKDIVEIIKNEFKFSPAKSAAMILHANGVAEVDLMKIINKISNDMLIPVRNELRDIERIKRNASLKKAN